MTRPKGEEPPKVQSGARISEETSARLKAVARAEKRKPADVQRLLIEFGLRAHDLFGARVPLANLSAHLERLLTRHRRV
jgi:hypothetical protein